MNYQELVNDCRQIVVEHEFISRWSLVEGYHSLGKRISQEENVTVTRLAKDIGKSTRTVQRSVQFYNKYPDIDLLPEGKNTSWHKIVNKYLPETVKEKSPSIIECPNCHTQWEK